MRFHGVKNVVHCTKLSEVCKCIYRILKMDLCMTKFCTMALMKTHDVEDWKIFDYNLKKNTQHLDVGRLCRLLMVHRHCGLVNLDQTGKCGLITTKLVRCGSL